jgi:non-heme chloroperoxidase
VTLAGHSTGGSVAICYAARHKSHGLSKLALFAAAAPSLIQRPDFPYGLPRETVENIISSTYADRPQMLHDFGQIFFHKKVTEPFENWFFLMGLKAASWSTVAVARTWLAETLFEDLARIRIPTLILHGVHDKVVPYPLAQVQHKGIAGSKLVTFENSGHGLFYDEVDKFNRELAGFVG